VVDVGRRRWSGQFGLDLGDVEGEDERWQAVSHARDDRRRRDRVDGHLLFGRCTKLTRAKNGVNAFLLGMDPAFDKAGLAVLPPSTSTTLNSS
jgi:hypothetical protein